MKATTVAAKKKKPKKPKPTDELVLIRSHFWIAAAIFQGERLMDLISYMGRMAIDPSKWTEAQREELVRRAALPSGRSVSEMEGYFFVYAVRHAVTWLGYAKRLGGKLAKAVAAFEKTTPHVQDIRDMIEHEDEYLTGGGKKADKYETPYYNLPATAHGTVLQGNSYKLGGGRIDVQETIAALRKVFPVVEATHMRVAPPKPPEFQLSVRFVEKGK